MVALQVKTDSRDLTDFKAWQVELLFAVPIVALVTTLCYNWFGVRDCHLIFLYDHAKGPGLTRRPLVG
jgi:hypothetical protein